MNGNRMRKGNLEGPLVIVAASSQILLLVRAQDAQNPEADAQIYDLSKGEKLDQIKPIGVWHKFLFYMEDVEPPVRFTEEERKFRVAAYQAAARAREKADGARES